jgi:hypothetical protein
MLFVQGRECLVVISGPALLSRVRYTRKKALP